MRSIKKFLIPVDYSSASLAAVKFASFLAKDFGGESVECVLVNVAAVDADDVEINSLENQLDRLITDHLTPNKVTGFSIVVRGDLYDELPKVKMEHSADLIIMGTDTSNRDHHYTADLIRKMDTSVLVVPASYENFQLKKIALAIDDKRIDDSSRLSLLNDFTRWFDMKMHLLLVSPDGKSTGATINDEVLDYYLQTIDYNHHVVVESDIEKGVFRYMEENDIDLAAILPRTHAKNMDPSEGKLTQAMVLHCTRPILVLD